MSSKRMVEARPFLSWFPAAIRWTDILRYSLPPNGVYCHRSKTKEPFTVNCNSLKLGHKINLFLHVVSDVWQSNDNVTTKRIIITTLGVDTTITHFSNNESKVQARYASCPRVHDGQPVQSVLQSYPEPALNCYLLLLTDSQEKKWGDPRYSTSSTSF